MTKSFQRDLIDIESEGQLNMNAVSLNERDSEGVDFSVGCDLLATVGSFWMRNDLHYDHNRWLRGTRRILNESA